MWWFLTSARDDVILYIWTQCKEGAREVNNILVLIMRQMCLERIRLFSMCFSFQSLYPFSGPCKKISVGNV